jgi:hypothetical protein
MDKDLEIVIVALEGDIFKNEKLFKVVSQPRFKHKKNKSGITQVFNVDDEIKQVIALQKEILRQLVEYKKELSK